MEEFKPRKKIIRRYFQPWVPVVLLILTVLCVRGVIGLYQKNLESRENLERVVNEMKTLEERKIVLEKDLSELKTTEGLEAELRTRFQVSKEGEKVIIFEEEEINAENNLTDDTKNEVEEGFFGRIGAWFGRVFSPWSNDEVKPEDEK